jgi:Na+/H+ antiporter NhaC
MKQQFVLTLAIVLVAIVAFLFYYYGQMEAEVVRQHLQSKQ